MFVKYCRRDMILIRDTKGGYDRKASLSKTLLAQIRTYFKEYRSKKWSFERRFGGQYTARSIQAMSRQAVERTGI